MKNCLFAFIIGIAFNHTSISQSWQKIDITSQSLGGFKSLCSHNGKLFGVSYNQGLMVSTDDGNTFTDITTDTLFSSQEFLLSNGSRLYLSTWKALQQDGRVWYSEDEGQSWTLDTAGGVPSARPIYWYSYNNSNHIVAQFQGDDNYFRRDINDNAWHVIDTFYKNQIDPLDFTASNDTLLAMTPNGLWYSTDNAINWTSLGQNGLPAYYNVHGFDFEGGRIYFIGKEFGKKPRFYYSDDFGSTWDTSAIGQFFAKNAFGTDQLPISLKAVGNDIWVSIQNEATNSMIDVIHSPDRGANWSYDTTGLHMDPFGTDAVGLMITHNQKLFAHTGLGRAYRKQLSSQTVGSNDIFEPEAPYIYPNPAADHLNIITVENLDYELISLSGKTVLNGQLNKGHNILQLPPLPKGIYLFITPANLNRSFSQKIMIEN